MKYLFIAEKSSLMKEIQSVYQKFKSSLPYEADFDCFSGHIVRRAEPKEYEKTHPEWGGKWEEINLPIIPEQFLLLVSDKAIYNRLIQKIKNNHYDAIVNACDPDREGMAIYELFHQKGQFRIPVKRFWTNDLTDKAILQALQNLRDNNHEPALVHLKEAALLRGEYDWYVGMNFTIAYSLKTKSIAKVGRVKTPTLALLVKRESELKNFKKEISYEVVSYYTEGFKATHINIEGEVKFKTEQEAKRFIDQLESVANIREISSKEEQKLAPALFKLSTLQIESSKAFGYKADDTLAICQYLYEQKITSYPRTDCEFISTELAKDFESMLRAVNGMESLRGYVQRVAKEDYVKVMKNSKYINDKKLAESGHSALVPTGNIPDFNRLKANLDPFNRDHKTKLAYEQVENVLELMFKRFLGIFFPPQRTLVKEVLLNNHGYLFKAIGKTILDEGFMQLYRKAKESVVPNLVQGQQVQVEKNEIEEKITTPPSRYTDGTLIAAMENPAKYLTDAGLKAIMVERNGIGTPATRAEVIKELIRNGYIERKGSGKGKKEYLIPTYQGISLIEQLKEEDIVSVDMTGEWESKLKQVEQGTLTYVEFKREMEDYIKQTIKHIQKAQISQIKAPQAQSIGTCPLCKGEIKEGTKSYYCANYKNGCKYGFSKEVIKGITKKSLTIKNVKEILETGKLLKQKGHSKNGENLYDCYFIIAIKEGRPNFELKFPIKTKK